MKEIWITVLRILLLELLCSYYMNCNHLDEELRKAQHT